MASSSESMDMDESFRARVDKVFGSLASSKSSPAWSLTGDEVERREWRRDTDTSGRDETPCSSSFDGFLPRDRKVPRRNRCNNDFEADPDDDDDDGGGEERREERDGDDDWDIRSSIGLDPTLDREEEEDEYDRVASGSTNVNDRLYMRDVTDHGAYLNSHNVLPKTKDPRANHLAAKIRLKEDQDEAKITNPSEANVTGPDVPSIKTSENGCQPKSILKRKDSDTVFKSRKRVRFNPGVKDDGEMQVAETSPEPSIVLENESAVTQNTRSVPDYILNPSKYKRYTFDSSSDVHGDSNTEACMDFLKQVHSSKTTESASELNYPPPELPKSVTFIPKKKGTDATTKINTQQNEDHSMQSMNRGNHPVGIAAGEVEEDEASAMNEDVPETNAANKVSSSQKPGRRFRAVSRSDDSDS